MQIFVGQNVLLSWKNIIKRNKRLEEEYVRNLEQKILKKSLAIKKDSIIEKIIGLDDIPIEKINMLLKNYN